MSSLISLASSAGTPSLSRSAQALKKVFMILASCPFLLGEKRITLAPGSRPAREETFTEEQSFSFSTRILCNTEDLPIAR